MNEGTIYRLTKATTSTASLLKKPNTIDLRPNPVEQVIQWTSELPVGSIQFLQIFNINGQLVQSSTLSNRIVVADLSVGCYVVKFMTKEGIINKTFIKQ